MKTFSNKTHNIRQYFCNVCQDTMNFYRSKPNSHRWKCIKCDNYKPEVQQ